MVCYFAGVRFLRAWERSGEKLALFSFWVDHFLVSFNV